MTTLTAAAPPRRAATPSCLTPLPDPPREPDMATQLPHVARAHIILQDWFSARPDVLVSGDGYLCYDARDIRRAPAPDCLVALDLPVPLDDIVMSNGYTISEIGKPPDFVLEIASQSTGQRDCTVKRTIYAGYGVAEYWRFDRTGGRFHDAALAGDRLEHGRYVRIPVTPMPDGVIRGYSAVLDLELRWVEGWLRFWDPVSREYLPGLSESKSQTIAERVAREMTELQRDAQAAARQAAERQRDAESHARQSAERQRDDALARLDAETAARCQAEERIRHLEARLAENPPDS